MSWRVAKSLSTLLSQVNASFPGRDKSSDGTIGDSAHAATRSEHNPDENGVVRAMDISNDPGHGISSQALADALVASRDPRILYIISNRRIISSQINAWDWRPYNGSNPHDHHVHISVVSNPSLYDDTRPWDLSALGVSQPKPVGPVVNTAGRKRFTDITATEFGGRSDPNTSAYDGHFIDDDEFGCALPFKFKAARPDVRVFKGDKSVVCSIVDVGPWNINDPYWTTGLRPQAESGTDNTDRHTNKAGIDLTPKAARALGVEGKGVVDWEFVMPEGEVIVMKPPITEPIAATKPEETNDTVTLILNEIKPILEKHMAAQPTLDQIVAAVQAAQTQQVQQFNPLSWLDKIFGGQATTGTKTATGILGVLASVIPLITGMVDPSGTTGTALMTLMTLFAGFGSLGLVAKIDRSIKIAQQVSVLLNKFVPDQPTVVKTSA